MALTANAERADFFPRPLAFSCTATHVPDASFQTDLYALLIRYPKLIERTDATPGSRTPLRTCLKQKTAKRGNENVVLVEFENCCTDGFDSSAHV